jgi:hypothetical protein
MLCAAAQRQGMWMCVELMWTAKPAYPPPPTNPSTTKPLLLLTVLHNNRTRQYLLGGLVRMLRT